MLDICSLPPLHAFPSLFLSFAQFSQSNFKHTATYSWELNVLPKATSSTLRPTVESSSRYKGCSRPPKLSPLAQMFGHVILAVAAVFLGCVYKAIKPPPPKLCGSLGGPPVSSTRIKLTDGRHLSYREAGVSKDEAKYKIIVVHGFAGSKDMILPVSRELVVEKKLYFLFYDRAGYGESDPYPQRSVKS